MLSIIVVSFNTKSMTLECLRSVFEQTPSSSFELIVLDNASSDGSADALEAEFGDNIRLIRSKDNMGFAAGNNVAITYAVGDLILLLNPDTIVLDKAIDKLVAYSNEVPSHKIWGGKTLFADHKLNPSSCWNKQTLWGLTSQALGFSSMFRKNTFFNPEGIGGWGRDGVRDVDIVSGCFFLIKTTLWKALGGFRESFFMYGEEADLCLRAAELGATPSVTDTATIVHYGGASETVRADKLVRLIHAKHLLIEYHFSPKTRVLGHFLLSLWPQSRHFAHGLLALLGCLSSDTKKEVWKNVSLRQNEWPDLLEKEILNEANNTNK